MEILRDYKQISSRVEKIFGVDVTNKPILDAMPFAEIKELLSGKQVNKDTNELSTLAELIFQLKITTGKQELNAYYTVDIIMFSKPNPEKQEND